MARSNVVLWKEVDLEVMPHFSLYFLEKNLCVHGKAVIILNDLLVSDRIPPQNIEAEQAVLGAIF